MANSGVIYDASWGKDKGTLVIASAKERGVICRAGVSLPTLGSKLANLLILTSFLGLFFIFGPLLKQELSPTPTPVHSYFGDLLKRNPLGFSLLIPKINLRTKIIANVDPVNKEEYQSALEKGIAHAKGSVFPGMAGNIYLFSHSSLTNPLFYQLKNLEQGDEVIVYFEGQAYQYQVKETQILGRSDTRYFQPQEEEQLILQTCWPPGTDLKQLVILAEPRQDQSFLLTSAFGLC